MHLYAHLDKLGDRPLYCDTDSVIFVQNYGELPRYNVVTIWET